MSYSNLTSQILEMFEDLNQAEEREFKALYAVKRLKHRLKADGKFGVAKPKFLVPTVSGHQLIAVHNDLERVMRPRRRGLNTYERLKLKLNRAA